jgi:hypothetical protein
MTEAKNSEGYQRVRLISEATVLAKLTKFSRPLG